MTSEQTSTRERVATAVSLHGPITARELAQQLQVTPAAVRRHLDALEADAVIAEHRAGQGPRGRGRPARAWVISERGHDDLPTAYDGLAVEALTFMQDTYGEQAVKSFTSSRANHLAARHAERVQAAGPDPRDRANALAEALREDGFASSTREVPGALGVQLCQGHCPVQHVAEAFPAVCDAEAEAFSKLLGVHVQRLATLPSGGHVCTTFIPTGPAGSHELSEPTPSRGEVNS